MGVDRVTLWGDGSPLREFLHADDLARAAVMLMCSHGADELGELINVGSGDEVTIAQLADLVREVVYADAGSRECAIEWDPEMPNGTPRKLLDSSRMRALGWAPRIGLREGVEGAYEDYLERHG